MYKLIAIDIDSTLITDKKELTEDTIKVLKKCAEKGIMVVLCSGRSPMTLRVIYDQLDFDMPFISYHGAMIVKGKSNEVLFKEGISHKDALKIAEAGEKYDAGVNMWSMDGKLWVNKIFEYTSKYINDAHYKEKAGLVSDFPKNYPYLISKILFYEKEEKISEIFKEAEEFTKGMNVDFYTSQPYFLEFVSKNANKGFAVKTLSEYYNIKQEEVIAFGDGLNDMSMIEYAGMGVAVENAHEELKKKADLIAPSNNDEGVAKVLKKYVLKED